MKEYETILAETNQPVVKEAINLSQEMNRWLFLGQTKHVCRYGTLSEGHEKITPAQKYAQATKELYYLGLAVNQKKVDAKKALADLKESEAKLAGDLTDWERLRAEAELEEAQCKIISCNIAIQDQMRMVDEFNQVRLELKPQVESQYPEGLEQAEFDNWKAVAEHRLNQNRSSPMNNIPLPSETKAMIGQEYGRPDMKAALFIEDRKTFESLEDQYGKQRLLAEVR